VPSVAIAGEEKMTPPVDAFHSRDGFPQSILEVKRKQTKRLFRNVSNTGKGKRRLSRKTERVTWVEVTILLIFTLFAKD